MFSWGPAMKADYLRTQAMQTTTSKVYCTVEIGAHPRRLAGYKQLYSG